MEKIKKENLLNLYTTIVARVRQIIISFIRFYQRWAPQTVRNSCRFQPSCSEYMILSVVKYGPIKGVKSGIGRIFRCKPPNGGLDLP